ncbi:MAG: hypothetical protein IPH80_13585 [Myxococcales bacterium]|nr:hypothetical protein [Myxococcales bacterium]MBP6844134.1 hypothetical protein [Kofleriaceae bacterium]
MSKRVWSVLVVALAAACGDDGGSPVIDAAIDAPVIDAAIDAAVPLDAATGQVWIRGTGITGAGNQIVLAFVGRLDGGPLGNICQPVTADPFSFVAAVQTQGVDPCTLTGVATIPDGTYTVTAGIYTPGQQTPTRCATTTVTVAGSGDVTLPAFGACP